MVANVDLANVRSQEADQPTSTVTSAAAIAADRPATSR
jgi:hypothetical protein